MHAIGLISVGPDGQMGCQDSSSSASKFPAMQVQCSELDWADALDVANFSLREFKLINWLLD